MVDRARGVLGGFPASVLVIGHLEDFERKVLDIGCAHGLCVDGLMGADFLLETFEGSEEIEKKCSRRAVFGFDSDTELGGVVRAWDDNGVSGDEQTVRVEDAYTNRR